MDKKFFFELLYPFQDRVLKAIAESRTEFYLTGGTASSRGYLHHRFSEDLDLFVNDSDNFPLWSDRIIRAISAEWGSEVLLREPRFVRLNVVEQDLQLKIEMVNDVPSRIGKPAMHPVLGLLDTAENILANKVSALLDRREPKDLADIWGFCVQLRLPLSDAISQAQSKAAGIFPADLARILDSVSRTDWEMIRWIEAPAFERFQEDLEKEAEKLLIL